MINNIEYGEYDAVILATAHKQFLDLDYDKLKKSNSSIIFDVKSVIDKKYGAHRL